MFSNEPFLLLDNCTFYNLLKNNKINSVTGIGACAVIVSPLLNFNSITNSKFFENQTSAYGSTINSKNPFKFTNNCTFFNNSEFIEF